MNTISLPSGLFTPKELSSELRPLFRKSLKSGAVIKITRGLYTVKQMSKWGFEIRPSIHEVLAKLYPHEEFIRQGAACANTFGFSTQVPMQEIFNTKKTSRVFYVGKQKITLRPMSPKRFLGNKEASMALSALLYMGKEECTSKMIHVQVKRLLTPESFEVLRMAPHLPLWLRELMKATET